MKEYYNSINKSKIDLEKDSCDFGSWSINHNDFSCCKHYNGFYIFLKPDEIESSDEYDTSDPYSVIENFQSEFHQRRLTCTLDLIKELGITQNINLLDLGCGEGHLTQLIKKEFPHYNVYGLDYSISAIDYAHTNFKDIDFVAANAYYPPYKDEFFDIIVCNNIWEHVPDPLNLLKSFNRILKPNGQLIISTPSRFRLINLLKVFVGREISFMSKHHVTEYTVGQVKEQLRYGGFSIDKIYSPFIKEKKIIYRLLKPIIQFVLKIIKSHHILESTAFYSAKKLS